MQSFCKRIHLKWTFRSKTSCIYVIYSQVDTGHWRSKMSSFLFPYLDTFHIQWSPLPYSRSFGAPCWWLFLAIKVFCCFPVPGHFPRTPAIFKVIQKVSGNSKKKAKSLEYRKCLETGKTTKSFEHRKCLETAKEAKSLEYRKCLETAKEEKFL